jgi:hypothetical protein
MSTTVTPPTKTKQPTVQIMRVSPQQAANWLERNHERNRKLRPRKVAEYAADMAAGRWVLGAQVIVFNTRGELTNGQHTLHAVCKSETTVPLLVLFNAPDRSLYVLDGGMRRSTDDRFGMAGTGHVRGCGATVRRLLTGSSKGFTEAVSDQRVDEFMGQYGASVDLAHRCLKGRFGQAAVRAVVVRAHIRKVPGERLERFAEVLSTGIMGRGENAAVLLRNVLVESKNVADSGTSRAKLYALTQTALDRFLAGDPVRALKPATAELFPIPGEAA